MSAATPAREAGPGICPGCGWSVVSALPCPRCAFLAASPQKIGQGGPPEPDKPLTKQERLFLAALLLRGEVGGRTPDVEAAMYLAVMVRLMCRRLTPPTPFTGGGRSHAIERPPADEHELPAVPVGGLTFDKVPLGTSPAVLRAYLKRLAAAWRKADCPL